jgi:hypothetical protein
MFYLINCFLNVLQADGDGTDEKTDNDIFKHFYLILSIGF